MENPYLTPPQVESPQSRSWGLGFAHGFQGPNQSSMTPNDKRLTQVAGEHQTQLQDMGFASSLALFNGGVLD
jgi:hypothetical protein